MLGRRKSKNSAAAIRATTTRTRASKLKRRRIAANIAKLPELVQRPLPSGHDLIEDQLLKSSRLRN